MARFFDYQPVAEEAGITPDDLGALRRRVEADHPGDEMMAELRLLRMCRAIQTGKCSLTDALKPEPEPRGLATTPTEG